MAAISEWLAFYVIGRSEGGFGSQLARAESRNQSLKLLFPEPGISLISCVEHGGGHPPGDNHTHSKPQE